MRIVQDNSKTAEDKRKCESCNSIIGVLKSDIKTFYEPPNSMYYGHGYTYFECPVCNYRNIIDIY